MHTLWLSAIGILLAMPGLAREPSAQLAKQCVTNMDSGLVAGYQREEIAGHPVTNIVHLCSEYFNLDRADVGDVSRAQNVADVMVKLRYTVIEAAPGKTLKRCIGIDDPSESHLIPVGTQFKPEDRKISMQLWTHGWKCKGDQ